MFRVFWPSISGLALSLSQAPGEAAEAFLAALLPPSATSGGRVVVDDYVTRWSTRGQNHSRSSGIEQVPVPRLLALCSRTVSWGLWHVCVDGGPGSVPSFKTPAEVQAADEAAAAARVPPPPPPSPEEAAELWHSRAKSAPNGAQVPGITTCLVYSFALTPSPRAADLTFEADAAASGCEVHYFNPRTGAALDAVGEGGEIIPGNTRIRLHRYTVGGDFFYDPAVATAGRHPETLREEQLWPRYPLEDIMESLGHVRVTIIHLAALQGREWEVVGACAGAPPGAPPRRTRGKWAGVDPCDDRVDQWLVEWNLQGPEDDATYVPDATRMLEWTETLDSLLRRTWNGEREAGKRGYSALSVLPVRGSRKVPVGLQPGMQSKYPEAAAVLGGGQNPFVSGALPSTFRGVYIRRTPDDLVFEATDGEFSTAAEYSRAHKARFCEEANALVRSEHGPDAVYESEECGGRGG
jgi:hypothetical protein